MANINENFLKAYNEISNLRNSLAPDIMLKLYAFYKQATLGDTEKVKSINLKNDLKTAFKTNAWIQLEGMTIEDAKKEYIKLASEILINKNKRND